MIYDDHLTPIQLTPEQENQLISGSVERRLRWHEMTRDYRDKALEVRQLYLENRPDGQQFNNADNNSRSNVRMPVVAQAVDSTLAQQHLATFPTDERFFKAHPRNKLSKERQIAYEDLSENRMQKINLVQKSKMDRLNAMLDGVSVVWHPYIREEHLRPVYTPRTIFGIPYGKPRKSYKEQVTLESTDFVPLNLEDWWIDPTVDNFDKTNFIWRKWQPVEEVKEIENYKNTSDLKAFGSAFNDSDSNLQEMYQYLGFEISMSDAETSLGKDNVMLFEEWGTFYLDGKAFENCVFVYSNDSVFHGLFQNPYDHGLKPFSISSYLPMPGTLMGKSIARDIVPLAHAYDAFLNGAIDIINSSAAPVWTYLVNDNALTEYFSEGMVVIEPGLAIPTQSHESLNKHQTDLQNLGVIAQLMQRVKEEIRESTGGVPYATGGLSGSDMDRTATEVSTLASGTSTRYQDVIQGYEDAKLKRFCWMWFENDRQFMSEPVLVDEEMLDPDEIKQMDFEFEVIGSKTAMSQSREAKALIGIMGMLPQLFQLGLFKPKQDQVEVDINGMLQQIGRSEGARNIDDYLNVVATQEEMQQGGGLEEVLRNGQAANTAGSPLDLGGLPAGFGMGAGFGAA